MHIHNQVCSLELSKKLKELGVEQNGLWSWCLSIGPPWNARAKDEWGLQLDGPEENEPNSSESYSAFTVAELGGLLPQQLGYKAFGGNPADKGKAFDLVIHNPRSSWEGWHISYVWYNLRLRKPVQYGHTVYRQNEADARAVMLVWLLETGAIELKEKS